MDPELSDAKTKLKQAIADFLDNEVVLPAVRLVDTDLALQDDIANVLILHQFVAGIAAEGRKPIDEYLLKLADDSSIENVTLAELLQGTGQAATLRTVFQSYVGNLVKSVCVSTLSASYLGAFVVTRSLLELLITVGSGKSGKMGERIDSLAMLSEDEKDTVREFWKELNGWTHPYGRWIKKICPVLIAKGPVHHQAIARECMACLGFCTDLAFAVALDCFGADPTDVRGQCNKWHVDYRRFQLLHRRLDKLPS